MTKLPKEFEWLNDEAAPRILTEFLKLYGTEEITGSEHNPVILAWADEIGGWVADYYDNDEIPWCGLFVGVIAKRAGYAFDQKLLSAKEWQRWGRFVEISDAMLADVLVFKREGGHHVGLYIAENKTHFLVGGGNQRNAVNIMPISKDRCIAARRSPFKTGQPRNVRKVYMDNNGKPSENEQ